MTTLFNIKRLSAVVLMLAFFMPLSQCSAPQKENSKEPPEIIVKYAYSQNTESPLATLASVAAFFWPALLAVVFTIKKVLSSRILFKLLELIFCLGTGYMLVMLNIFGKPLYGSYVATSAISIYGLLTLYEIFVIIRVKKHKKQ